jgi:hypothetical protein
VSRLQAGKLGHGILFLIHSVQTDPRTHSASFPKRTGGAFSAGLKRQGREADHLSLSSARVQNDRPISSPLRPRTPLWVGP